MTAAKEQLPTSFKGWYENYLSWCDSQNSSRVTSTKKQIDIIKEKIRLLLEEKKKPTKADMDQVDKLELQMRQESNKLAQIKKVGATIKGKMEAGWEEMSKQIKAHPKVKSFGVGQNGFIEIFTKNLTSDGDSIGKFRITYSTTHGIWIYNLSYEYSDSSGRDHWGINSNVPCLGGWGDGIHLLSSKAELFLFIDSLILYLSVAGDDGAYMKRDEWISDRSELTKEESEKKVFARPGQCLTRRTLRETIGSIQDLKRLAAPYEASQEYLSEEEKKAFLDGLKAEDEKRKQIEQQMMEAAKAMSTAAEQELNRSIDELITEDLPF